MKGLRLEIKGQVQGVGFRPYIYGLAEELGLFGWVKNNGGGVSIEIAGWAVSQFLEKLQKDLPPLARIDDIHIEPLPDHLASAMHSFEILKSDDTEVSTIISPDAAVCEACLQELFDPRSRFYLYPFLNCTHCGPRFTITRKLPYDRAQTSMDVFDFCEACLHDYHDPKNRRYHAQPTACAQCGPALSAHLNEIIHHISQGKIVAVKSLGGYQLVCDAHQEAAISALRKRKQRDSKPFALMLLNVESARCFVEISEKEALELVSRERPIVLLKQRQDIQNRLPDRIAPGLSNLGIMLPYTPLHYLLFHALMGSPSNRQWMKQIHSVALIVTSANPGEIPLVIEDEVAQSELKGMADYIVSYNRKIVTRMDDSVVRLMNQKRVYIRRARGYTPLRIELSREIPPTLALGSHLKNTFCVTRGKEAFVSQYIGDMRNVPTLEFFDENLKHFLKFLNIKPERIACDLHPDFYTSHLAHTFNLPVFCIQHHHAHLASVMAEHHLDGTVLGLALDGYGMGEEGGLWGGELFLLSAVNYKRIGHFYPIPCVGGDWVTREPWRIAASILYELSKNDEALKRFSHEKKLASLLEILKRGINIPRTSSCGRLFDAASALLGIGLRSTYEGEAAIKLENWVSQPQVLPNGWFIENDQFNMLPTMNALLKCGPQEGANLFHGTLIAGLTDWLLASCQKYDLLTIVLSGGCFMNKILTEGLVERLLAQNLNVYFSEQLPPNDAGLSLGQAWAAGDFS